MDKITLHLKADEQILTSAECPFKLASNTVSYVEAVFELGENWTGYDSVRAVWTTYLDTIATVLDSEGKCVVPHEVLTCTGKVSVNLVGSIVEDEELTDRLTTYPTVALNVNADAYVEGTETAPITPSQFEQYVADVAEEVAKIKDIESTTLNDDYTLTFVFSDGTSTTVGPIRGEQGEQGIQGPQGPEGPPGEVTMAQFEEAFPTDTASGAIASFPDGTDLFGAKSLVVEINPIQDTSGGDPSPTNICPISGWDSVGVVDCGKNLFNKNNYNVLSAYFNSGVIASGGSSRTITWVKCKPNTTYTASRLATASNDRFALAWSDKVPEVGDTVQDQTTASITTTVGTKISRTLTTGATAKYLVCWVGWTDRDDDVSTLQLEEGTTATTYESYNGTTKTVTLPSTTYGGSVDIVKGVNGGSSTLESVSLNGSSTPSFSEVSSNSTADGTKYVAFINMNAYGKQDAQAYCDKYKWVDKPLANLHVGEFNTRGSYIRFVLTDQSLDTLAKLNADLANNPIQLVYTKKTADTFSVTPQQISILKATNNIFADSGNVSVTYKADTQLWVEKMLSE